MQRAALHRVVDRRDERRVLAVGTTAVALADRGLEAAEVRLHRRGVAPVLQTLA
jgi:hypothetical protein